MGDRGLSAGLLLFRRRQGRTEVLLIHPGGPYWRRRDAGAWQIPKGLIEKDEDAARAALREFGEELGTVPDGTPQLLGRIRQPGGKLVEAFVLEGDLDTDKIVSNQFALEWPPGSGRIESFPEVDRAAWLETDAARAVILPSQGPLLDLLEAMLTPPTDA